MNARREAADRDGTAAAMPMRPMRRIYPQVAQINWKVLYTKVTKVTKEGELALAIRRWRAEGGENSGAGGRNGKVTGVLPNAATGGAWLRLLPSVDDFLHHGNKGNKGGRIGGNSGIGPEPAGLIPRGSH